MAHEAKDTSYLIVIGVLAIALLWAFFGNGKSGSRTGSDNYNDGDIKCQLQDANGRTITITGSGPEFERMCRQQNVNLYNTYWTPVYYYRWWNPWGWRRHHHSGGSGGDGGSGGSGGGSGM